MNSADKKEFVKNFCDSIRDEAMSKIEAMPEDWDGHELRKYLADKFEWEVTSTMREGRSKRVKEYGNTCINRNL